MALREFKLPDPGEGLTEAEIVTWHVAVGDTVKVNDIVVEVETAKSLVELPVPFAGTGRRRCTSPRATPSRSAPPIITVDDGARRLRPDAGRPGSRRGRARHRGPPAPQVAAAPPAPRRRSSEG